MEQEPNPYESAAKIGSAVFVFLLLYNFWSYIVLFCAMVGAYCIWQEYKRNQ